MAGKRLSFLVVGLGTFGRQAAIALSEYGGWVLAVDSLPAAVDQVATLVDKSACVDASDETAMEALGAFGVDAAIVALGDHFATAVLVTHMLRTRRVTRILVQVDSQRQASAIRAVGATSVTFPERDSALLLARALMRPDIVDQVALGRDAGIVELPCPAAWTGHCLRELDLRKRHSVTVIAIRTPAQREGEDDPVSVSPDPDRALQGAEVLFVLGHNHHLERLRAALEQPGR